MAELHGLGGSCSLVQQGGVGHGHASDVTDHGLVVEERLQATLGDFRLVGRVLSHPEKQDRHNESRAGPEDNSAQWVALKGPGWDRLRDYADPLLEGFCRRHIQSGFAKILG